MRFRIENFGIIDEADIEMNNITVIAGENDSGKSTFSKLVYSVIKANNTYEDDYNDFIVRKLSSLSSRMYRQMRKSSNLDYYYPEFREYMSPKMFERAIRNSINSPDNIAKIAYDYFERFSEYQRVSNSNMNRKQVDRYEAELRELLDMLNIKTAKTELMKPSLEKYLGYEFENEMSPKFKRVQSSVIVSDGYDEVLEFGISNNKFEYVDFAERLIFTDVTYIESPFILNRQYSSFHRESGRDQDLLMKLKKVRNRFERLYDNSIYRQFNLINDSYLFRDELLPENQVVSKIIGGSFEYNIDDDEFYFRKGKRAKHKINNVASGIKSFGVLNLLLSNNSLEPGSLVIIDEPEVHLHPKWQVEYGRLICILSQSDISFLINSHSPYLIEAINHYSKKYRLEKNVNFYLAQKDEGDRSSFIDCNYNLNLIHEKLSEPIERLVWED